MPKIIDIVCFAY